MPDRLHPGLSVTGFSAEISDTQRHEGHGRVTRGRVSDQATGCLELTQITKGAPFPVRRALRGPERPWRTPARSLASPHASAETAPGLGPAERADRSGTSLGLVNCSHLQLDTFCAFTGQRTPQLPTCVGLSRELYASLYTCTPVKCF